MSRHKRIDAMPKRGAALVEFAIVAPFLMLMLLGIIEFGRALAIQQTVTTAARMAAREATLPSANTSTVGTVAADMVPQIPSDDVTVAITNEQGATITPDQLDAGDKVTVDVSVPLVSVSRMGSFWFGDNSTISSSSTMRKEGYD